MTAAAATIVAALHVSDRIKDYGSYAGFACVLGLAVLSLLYFAQAREVKRLREWAGRAPERDAELQARVTAEAQQRATVTAAPAPAAAAAAAAPKPATAAATPAGQAAAPKPATAPAQQPAGQPAQQPAAQPAQTPAGQPVAAPKPGVPAPATAAAAAAGAAAAASASPTTTKPAEEKPDAQKDGDGATPPPSTPKPVIPVGASPNGAVDQPTQITPAPAAAAAAAAATPKPAPKPGQPLRPPTTAAAVADDEHDQSPLRTTLVIVGGVLGVIAVVLVLVLVVFNGSDNKPSPNTIGGVPASTGATSTNANGKSNASKPAPISRGDVTVAVLNGTTVPGLAREVGTKLQNAGFKLGTVTNAPDQARSATVVAYEPGHENEARVVARLTHVGSDAVKPIDQSTAVVAGQDAFVVVTVGADQSQ
jgi:hypothetical protein